MSKCHNPNCQCENCTCGDDCQCTSEHKCCKDCHCGDNTANRAEHCARPAACDESKKTRKRCCRKQKPEK